MYSILLTQTPAKKVVTVCYQCHLPFSSFKSHKILSYSLQHLTYIPHNYIPVQCYHISHKGSLG